MFRSSGNVILINAHSVIDWSIDRLIDTYSVLYGGLVLIYSRHRCYMTSLFFTYWNSTYVTGMRCCSDASIYRNIAISSRCLIVSADTIQHDLLLSVSSWTLHSTHHSQSLTHAYAQYFVIECYSDEFACVYDKSINWLSIAIKRFETLDTLQMICNTCN